MNRFNILRCVLFVAISCLAYQPVSADCDQNCRWENNSSGRQYICDCDFPVGWIIAIVIVGLLLFIGVPVLLCFCCAWACFKGRGKKTGEVHVVYAPPQPGQHYPQQGAYPAQQLPPGWTVTNGQGQGQGQGQVNHGYYGSTQPQQMQPYSAYPVKQNNY